MHRLQEQDSQLLWCRKGFSDAVVLENRLVIGACPTCSAILPSVGTLFVWFGVDHSSLVKDQAAASRLGFSTACLMERCGSSAKAAAKSLLISSGKYQSARTKYHCPMTTSAG